MPTVLRASLGIPKQRGTKSELATPPLRSWGPRRGQKCCVTPGSSGIPKQRGTRSALAATPLSSRGRIRGQKCYVSRVFSGKPKQRGKPKQTNIIGSLTPAFPGAQKRAEVLHNPFVLGDPQTKGEEISIGCLTLAFFGVHKRAEALSNPLRPGAYPNTGKRNHNWLPHPCLPGGPKEGGSAT